MSSYFRHSCKPLSRITHPAVEPNQDQFIYLLNWTLFSLLYSLEADKIQIEIELNQLKQKCSVANDDLKEMTTKCHNLEDELMKEKLTNQYGQHYANIPAASKSINTVSQEVGQSMLK